MSQKLLFKVVKRKEIRRPNCALARDTILGLNVPRFQRKILKQIKFCRNDQRERNIRRRTKGVCSSGIHFQFPKSTVNEENLKNLTSFARYEAYQSYNKLQLRRNA